jgi:hypothetical protein
MGRACWYLAAASLAVGVGGCHLGKQAITDAGRDAEQGVLSADAGAADSGTPPAPLANVEAGHPLGGPHCAAGEVAVLLQPDEETCVVECKSASDCPPEWMCNGEGALSHNGRPGTIVRFCRSVVHGKLGDGGALHAAALDAGHDAGRPQAGGGQPAKKSEPQHDGGAKPK